MFELYHNDMSVCAAKVRIVLAEKGLEWKGYALNLRAGDALKPEYLAYLEALVPRLSPGALVAADNVLWSGRTSGARPDNDARTDDLRRFNSAVLADPRFRATILPLGDGLLIAGFRG